MKAYLTLLYCSILIFASCKKDNSTVLPTENFRTVLVYLAANNNLQLEAYKNLEQMENTIGDIDGNLLVYARLPNTEPALYEITRKTGATGGRRKIKSYLPHNSSDPNVMRTIIDDVFSLYPAKSTGLILWSHATGWVPSEAGPVKLKSFGDDNGRHMDITDLNQALPTKFDFIMFDACSMASVEVLYEIKDKAAVFIASPGEVISNGMPYDKMTNDLFDPSNDSYQRIAQKYYQHYNGLSGLYQSATISVINASKLEQFAVDTKNLLTTFPVLHHDLNRNKVQRMDFDREGNPLIAFDYWDFVNQNFENSIAKKKVQESLLNVVAYRANTPYFNGFKIDSNAGLTVYIPHKDNAGIPHDFYKTLKWYTASGFNHLF
ncbi:clostripain-related cysteine peptidase [Sphingobacterium sp. Mn56C]|uniref:clostripain-related cysteine peptidase n=1 Tax=Sphingobacterium sp. Mn56C TaxID=3395261 RepID=UPI003BCC4056